MFAKSIIDSDAFLDMSLSTQALYFHLSMRADDDGFVNNPNSIVRMLGSDSTDLKELIDNKFIELNEDGCVSIYHWKINNFYIGKKRKCSRDFIKNRIKLLEEHNGYCSYCGSSDGPFEIDHVLPVALGGEDVIENLVVACRCCNRSKGSKPVNDWRQSS